MNSQNLTLFVIFFYLLWILFNVILPIVEAIKKKIEGGKTKEKEQENYINWINNIEPIQTKLHRYPEDWGMRRNYIAKKVQYTCQSCGRKGWLGFHIHHIIPLSRGGDNSLDNLTYLCRQCHENLHPHMLEERKIRKKQWAAFRRKIH